ncbi:hypothetical protein [Methylobacterium aquaticum]|uniref:Uncharacterized protein n=1 Tax=Methylobacterium aquaticum TaxID=270351 RepID=A0A0C6FXJ6_9HYPH|nr:hypothetical protein [Methylobacterium aquaticum]BAQ48055.1 hypothetical protein Maq22A_c25900 [Methylobacterium aquaticum]
MTDDAKPEVGKPEIGKDEVVRRLQEIEKLVRELSQVIEESTIVSNGLTADSPAHCGGGSKD